MSLKKLPYEYPEIRKSRWEECFGDLPIEKQLELIEVINKICELTTC
jgi:hypothetical protein